MEAMCFEEWRGKSRAGKKFQWLLRARPNRSRANIKKLDKHNVFCCLQSHKRRAPSIGQKSPAPIMSFFAKRQVAGSSTSAAAAAAAAAQKPWIEK